MARGVAASFKIISFTCRERNGLVRYPDSLVRRTATLKAFMNSSDYSLISGGPILGPAVVTAPWVILFHDGGDRALQEMRLVKRDGYYGDPHIELLFENLDKFGRRSRSCE
jgi:hypothetical protein